MGEAKLNGNKEQAERIVKQQQAQAAQTKQISDAMQSPATFIDCFLVLQKGNNVRLTCQEIVAPGVEPISRNSLLFPLEVAKGLRDSLSQVIANAENQRGPTREEMLGHIHHGPDDDRASESTS